MSHSLLISVRLHEGWYHGSDSSPSPARLFQALVAGQGLRGPLTEGSKKALSFLEDLAPPVVATPSMHAGQLVVSYVPNNDLDSKQGDHRRIGEIRTQKRIQPRLFDAETSFLFSWPLTADQAESDEAREIVSMTNDIYQLGRTVDAAWAWAEIVSEDEAAERIRQHEGPVHRPGEGAGSVECPMPGSLDSVIRRHQDMSQRYGLTADRKGQTFRRRAKPKWRRVNYQHGETFVSFDLQGMDEDRHFRWPFAEAAKLVEAIRDASVAKLKEAMPARSVDIERTLIGRKQDGSNNGPSTDRVRIVPLPSVGHEHADRQVRRVAIAIPSSCPLRFDDVAWAFSGLVVESEERRLSLVRSGQNPQAKFYKIDSGKAASWQSVTAIALGSATRRRIEPNTQKRTDTDLKGANERSSELNGARRAIGSALRHAGISTKVINIQLQREPFDTKGLRAEEFAEGTRFNKHSMWHAKIDFAESVPGPIVIGDGRFLGLGVMNAVDSQNQIEKIHAFHVSELSESADPLRVCTALRRAVMSRVHNVLGLDEALPPFFSGHEPNGAPADSTTQSHLYFACDVEAKRLYVFVPSVVDRSVKNVPRNYLRSLTLALQGLSQLKAGQAGLLATDKQEVNVHQNRLFRASKFWTSLTPYSVNRHVKKKNVQVAIEQDVLEECLRRGLPRPEVRVSNWEATSGKALQASVTLCFQKPVAGPVMLGRTRHKGGGLFAAVDTAT